jgi:hypothetical protein
MLVGQTSRGRIDLDSVTARRLRRAFPSSLVTDADAVLTLVEIGQHEPSEHDIGFVVVGGEVLHIPPRIYSPEVGAEALIGLTTSARTVWDCLFTRHHDGHVREKYLRAVISSQALWVPPFVIQLLGEYVAEIHLVIRRHIDGVDSDAYHRFVAENPAFIELTRQRIASYWNCYYRSSRSQLRDYAAHQVIEVLDAPTGAAQTAVAVDGASPRR